ncbi:MAG: hypothetical protein AB1511_14550 [Deinococcota bacterium]
MIFLTGRYQISATKKLTLNVEGDNGKGAVQQDIRLLLAECQAGHGHCQVRVWTQHGEMTGLLTERRTHHPYRWLLEGHLAFLPANR